MIDGLFGSLFGGANPETWAPNADQLRAAEKANVFLIQNARPYPQFIPNQATRVLEPGIFWTKTGGKTHRVVIRRTPAVVIDLSGLGG